MNWTVALTGTASGVIGAVVTDLQSWAKHRESDPTAAFDWTLALTRWAIGGLTALGPSLGIGSVAGVK